MSENLAGQADAQESELGSNEEVVLRAKALDDARDDLVGFLQRHKNVLSSKNLHVAEAYADGRLVLVLDLECVAGGHTDHIYASIAADDVVFHRPRNVTVWVTDDDLWNYDDANRQDQRVMLVRDIELVEPPQGRSIPSVVRLQRFDEIDGLFGGPLYLSFKVGFKVLPVLVEGEPGMAADFSAARADQVTGEMIERGSQIVDGVAGNQVDVSGKGFGEVDTNPHMPGLSIWMNDHSVRVLLDESAEERIKVRDVLIGPFSL